MATQILQYAASPLLGEQFGITRHNLHLPHLLCDLLVLELRICQNEGPHIVTEPVSVQMALYRRRGAYISNLYIYIDAVK
jgi:hypothetical protein